MEVRRWANTNLPFLDNDVHTDIAVSGRYVFSLFINVAPFFCRENALQKYSKKPTQKATTDTNKIQPWRVDGTWNAECEAAKYAERGNTPNEPKKIKNIAKVRTLALIKPHFVTATNCPLSFTYQIQDLYDKDTDLRSVHIQVLAQPLVPHIDSRVMPIDPLSHRRKPHTQEHCKCHTQLPV